MAPASAGEIAGLERRWTGIDRTADHQAWRPAPPGGRARVCLPAPHPAIRALLAAGWRNDDLDLYMVTEPGLLDPRRAVPPAAPA